MSNDTSTVKKLLSYDKDCLSCRIVSGCGLIGAGCYVASHSRRPQPAFGRLGMATLSIGIMGLGTARLFNMPPFDKHLEDEGLAANRDHS